jgi:DMSO/TMAO reductase YedYZ molybdopterin-dependent catalytic subunit
LPPGQYLTERFPVLHAGVVPNVDLAEWDFVVDGLVDEARVWKWDEFKALPMTSVTADIHCVTKWSKLDTDWAGVSVRSVWDLLDPAPTASHVAVKAYHGFTANLPVEEFLRDANLFAYEYGGEALDAEHGYPRRLVVPHLYFWKSVKWVRGFTVLTTTSPGSGSAMDIRCMEIPLRSKGFGATDRPLANVRCGKSEKQRLAYARP